ncbi:thiamine phosphate synthase [Gaopeijia maritima]|uniref:thiamine phosphate synthase n=1 Tax=Gaopeijia maritima TaxID=3119007 RepID=UPI00327C4B05
MTRGNRVVVPPVHLITDDAVLAHDEFDARMEALLALGGAQVALHVRGAGTPGRRLQEIVERAREVAGEGARVIVNDRLDVALAAGADGVQLARRSLPLAAARTVAPALPMGLSVHAVEDIAAARAAGARGPDWFVAGTIWPTASHPDRPGGGLDHLRAMVESARAEVESAHVGVESAHAGVESARAGAASAPVIAIGGVTPERTVEARRAGAGGVAVLRGVWAAVDPVEALSRYLSAWNDP